MSTLTEAIPAPTVTFTLAFLPEPSVALQVMVAVPSPTPFTTPLDVTVATFLLEVFQTTFLLTFFLGVDSSLQGFFGSHCQIKVSGV